MPVAIIALGIEVFMKWVPAILLLIWVYSVSVWLGLFLTAMWGFPMLVWGLTYWYCKLVVKYADENPEVYNRTPDICKLAYDDIMEQKYKESLLIKIARS